MEKIYFISDTHFKYHITGEDEREKRKRFLSFIEEIGSPEALFLVGDIFDFWFEYESVVPAYYRDVLHALRGLRENGTKIFISRGNHDYWLGRYISDEIGITILPDLSIHNIQGRTVAVTHGDTLLHRDYAYKVLKSVIRNKAVIALAKCIHPDILFSFAKNFSRTSKGVTHKKTERSARELIARAPEDFFRWSNDIFIMGHIHFPVHRKFGDREFVILGDWEENFSYLEMENGNVSLKRYTSGKNTLIENL